MYVSLNELLFRSNNVNNKACDNAMKPARGKHNRAALSARRLQQKTSLRCPICQCTFSTVSREWCSQGVFQGEQRRALLSYDKRLRTLLLVWYVSHESAADHSRTSEDISRCPGSKLVRFVCPVWGSTFGCLSFHSHPAHSCRDNEKSPKSYNLLARHLNWTASEMTNV